MRLTEDVTEQLYAEADAGSRGDGEPARAPRRAARASAALREHGALLRAIVEVSTYDEEVARSGAG